MRENYRFSRLKVKTINFLNILFLHVHPRTPSRETFQRLERALMGLQELINYGKSIGIVELSLKAAKRDVYAQLRR